MQLRYRPCLFQHLGIEFDNSPDDLTVIFNPDGSAEAGYTITFKEMYIDGAVDHVLTVNQLTGWVSVDEP